jgi:uncharacterized membrane protein YfcA
VDVLTLVGVGIWCFLVALAGGLVGLVLGNIRLPVLLFAAASPAAAGGANIAVSGLAAAAASITHIRARRVDWRLVAWMLPPSVLGAIGGGAAASYVPADALRILIGSALLLFGIDLLRPRRSGPIPPPRAEPDIRAAVLSGAVIGVLGGLIGLILGSLRMPALLRWVGEEPARAVGTNLVVGVAVGAAGLLGHLPGGIDWTLLAVGAAGSIPGALIGSRLTGRLSPANLLRAVGVILLIAGIAAIAQGVV